MGSPRQLINTSNSLNCSSQFSKRSKFLKMSIAVIRKEGENFPSEVSKGASFLGSSRVNKQPEVTGKTK